MAVKMICGALVVDANRLVLVKEAGVDYGKWNFPAGHLDEGEDIFQAAVREVKEETNLDVKLEALLGIYQQKNRQGESVIRILFKASLVGGKLKHPEELLDAKWFTFEEFGRIEDEELRSLDLRLAVETYKNHGMKSLDTIKIRV